jgi:hypothetical protein
MNVKQRRLAEKEHTEARQAVMTLLETNCIEHAQSPWNAPLVLVKKPDGSLRVCIDYRKLNEATVKDVYPLPRMDEMIDQLGGGTVWFTTLDAVSGYHQMKLDEESKPATAFSVRGMGQFQWKVVPMGLTNSPAVFQRYMDMALAKITGLYCLVYIDDIIVFSKSWTQHLKHIEGVLQTMKEED